MATATPSTPAPTSPPPTTAPPTTPTGSTSSLFDLGDLVPAEWDGAIDEEDDMTATLADIAEPVVEAEPAPTVDQAVTDQQDVAADEAPCPVEQANDLLEQARTQHVHVYLADDGDPRVAPTVAKDDMDDEQRAAFDRLISRLKEIRWAVIAVLAYPDWAAGVIASWKDVSMPDAIPDSCLGCGDRLTNYDPQGRPWCDDC